jgi:twinkle protein
MAKRIEGKRLVVGDTLADIFAEAGIRAGRARLVAGRDAKVVCPACGDKETSLSVKVDADGLGATWHCFRGKCPGSSIVPGCGRISDGRGAAQVLDQPLLRRERAPAVAPVLDPPEMQRRDEALLGFFARRGISEETVAAFGVYGTTKRWPELDEDGKPVKDGEGELIWSPAETAVFPYRWRGEVVNRKFRSCRKQFMQDRDSLRTLFNADAIETPDVVVLVEGEMDVMACWEAGLRQVVSLPDGSPNKLLSEDDPKRQDDQRFDPLENCGDVLAEVKRFVIATDADVPGGYLAEELARRLGRARCWRVTWPDGCKDANDVLMHHGAEVVRAAIEAAEPWPLEGIFDLKPGALHAFLHTGREPTGMVSGIANLDEIAKIPAGGGWLTIVTGVPSHGKSSLLRTWLTYTAAKHDIGIVWCSPEDNRPETLALRVASVFLGRPMREAGGYVPKDILQKAEEWIARRISFLWSDNPDVEMTLDWVLARAEEAKRRYPRSLLVLDPWNEFEHQFTRQESETQYTGRWLRKLKAWGRAEGMGIIIAAHPTKLQKDPKTGSYPVADGYDINGGANWFNKADLGVTVYRRDEGFPEVHCWKARYEAFGQRYQKARLKLDVRTGRLSSPGFHDTPSIATGEE